MSSVLNSAEILNLAYFINAGGKEKEIGDQKNPPKTISPFFFNFGIILSKTLISPLAS